MESQNEDCVREISLFGPDLGPLIFKIDKHLVVTNGSWQVYRTLFGSLPERHKFLFDVANITVGKIENALWSDVVVSICKVMDPAEQGKFKNLSLFKILETMEETTLRIEFENLLTEATSKVEPLRNQRNGILAHLDYDVATGEVSRPLISRSQVQRALDAVNKPIQRLYEEKYIELRYGPSINASSSAIDFLNILHRGAKLGHDAEYHASRPEWLNFSEWER